MIDVRAICDLHEKTVARWHTCETDNPYEGFLRRFAFSMNRISGSGIRRTSPAAPT